MLQYKVKVKTNLKVHLYSFSLMANLLRLSGLQSLRKQTDSNSTIMTLEQQQHLILLCKGFTH